MGFFEYILANQSQILSLTIEHIKLTILSVSVAMILGIPLGILICYIPRASQPVLGVANLVQAIPSMALLGFMIPFLGIGTTPAVVAVILYSLLPIIKNTYTGISNINQQTVEAARGIGLTRFQVLWKVQIPLALPVIMAGVRISAVTAVGLMTIAAFIGAGGLGYLVFSGIRTVNNNQILAGAIPACLLALGVDAFVAMIENMVTPRNMRESVSTRVSSRRKYIVAFAACVFAGLFMYTHLQGGVKNDKIVKIGSKDFTEQIIIGNMVSDMIEYNTDIKVDRKMVLGGTQVCFSALRAGSIDMYVEYSGTGYTDMLNHPPISDMQRVYDTVKREFNDKYNIKVLKQMNFNNTYTLAVTKDSARKYNLHKISDLENVAKHMKSGTTFEFLNREDGLKGIEQFYGFKFRESVALDGAPRYGALVNKDVDIVDAFSTDGLLKKFDLRVLTDDKQFFPPYYAMPIIRADTLKKYPEIQPLMDKLGATLNNKVMTELNYQVDELQKEPHIVAKEFLKKQGLIK